MTNSLRLSTPVGIMTLTASETAIVRLCFGDEIPADSKALSEEEESDIVQRLNNYNRVKVAIARKLQRLIL